MIIILLIQKNAYSHLLVLILNPKTFTVSHLVNPAGPPQAYRSSVNFGEGARNFLPKIMYEKN